MGEVVEQLVCLIVIHLERYCTRAVTSREDEFIRAFFLAGAIQGIAADGMAMQADGVNSISSSSMVLIRLVDRVVTNGRVVFPQRREQRRTHGAIDEVDLEHHRLAKARGVLVHPA